MNIEWVSSIYRFEVNTLKKKAYKYEFGEKKYFIKS